MADKIFIVEDDTIIAREVMAHLNSWGFTAKSAVNFKNIIEEFKEFSPKLVLLDISLPFYNGYHWCSELRKISSVPIIFISSASDNMNIVMAMNMGGDDFIGKPFDLTVLTAKIQAVLRRAYSLNENGTTYEDGSIILNISELSIANGTQKTDLTKNECKILEVLFSGKGKCISREDIMGSLWENDSFVDDNTLTVNVTRIRKKLELIGVMDYIITKKGLGYMIK